MNQLHSVAPTTFNQWRDDARSLLANEVSPDAVVWNKRDQYSLFQSLGGRSQKASTIHLPRSFLSMLQMVALHRNEEKWSLMYRLLWRYTHDTKHLLFLKADPDIVKLSRMDKEVRRDIHKMHAFVRFRKVLQGEDEWYIAWHKPDHLIVEEVAPFFLRRFASMKWAILTPDASAFWDGIELAIREGVPPQNAPAKDGLEELWRDYFKSVFNPARVKIKAMKAEMPRRHWKTLPEASALPELLRDARGRVEEMLQKEAKSAVLPEEKNITIPTLKDAASACTACPLYKNATSTVFGEGNPTARVVFIGEQPGDEEDRQARPFVGPAGRLFTQALKEAGFDRKDIYITNAVKHFKWIPRGKRRIHQKPNGAEINACKPWLEGEIAAIKPELIVCLGATAAQSLLGRAVKITTERGKFAQSPWGPKYLITMHPSAILRIPDKDAQQKAYEDLLGDLEMVHKRLSDS